MGGAHQGLTLPDRLRRTRVKKFLSLTLLLIALCACALCEECSHNWSYREDGSAAHVRTCTKCGASETQSHSYTTNRVAPTCSESGYVKYVCSACGYTTEFTEDPPTGKHDWGSYNVITEPTCASEGLEERTCSICGQTETVTLASADHDFGSYTRYGENHHSRVCSVCGFVQVEEHDSSISKVVTTARDTRLGKKSCTCAKCGAGFMCFYSVYDTLYPVKGTDILENGTSYLKVNTVTLTAGNSRVLDLYSAGKFELTASANTKMEIYASAETGCFTGLYLTSGNALLTVTDGGAGIEFIKTAPGSALTLALEDGCSLTLGSREVHTIVLRERFSTVGVTRAERKDGVLQGSVSCFGGNRLTLSGSGDDIKISGAASSLIDGEFIYDTVSGSVSARSGADVKVTVWDGFGEFLAEGDGEVSTTAPYDSFYFTFAGDLATIFTPYIEKDGSIGYPAESVGEAADGGSDVDASERVTGYLTFKDSMEETVSESPRILVKIKNGMYSVTVSELPGSYVFENIMFIQNYAFPGQKRLISYAADASFPIDRYDSTLSAVVTLSYHGKTYTYPAGQYEFRAE